MGRRHNRRIWPTGTALALAAVVGLASPAAAADPSSTTVTASPAAAAVGQNVTLTATVSCPDDPSPGLGMTFFDGAVLLTTVPVSVGGEAQYTTTFSTTGTHTITAAYNGNDNCLASNNTTDVQVSSVTPTPPSSGFCLLFCGGLFGFKVGDIHQHVDVD